jgi:hypothetical protein
MALVANPFGFEVLQSYSLLIAAVLSAALLVVLGAAVILDCGKPGCRPRGSVSHSRSG